MNDIDLPALHEQALAWTHDIVAGIRPDQWTRPTPCDGWDTHYVANHVISGNFWVAPLVEGKTIADVGDQYDGDVLGSDAKGAYELSAKQAGEAFFEPGAMERPCAVSYGPVPGSVYCGHRIFDVAMHGWDLASATDQDTTMPAPLVEAVWHIIEPQAEGFRGAGVFGPAVPVGEGAPLQSRLLGLVGRRPGPN